MIYFISSMIAIAVEVVCCKLFYEIFGGNTRREYAVVPELLFWFLVYIGGVAIVFLMGDFMWLKLGLYVLWLGLAVWRHQRIPLLKSLIISAFFVSLILIPDYLVIMMNSSLWTEQAGDTTIAQLIMTLLSKTLLFLITFLLWLKIRSEKVSDLSDSDWLRFLFFPFFSVSVMVMSIKNSNAISEAGLEYLIWTITVGMIIMNIFLFFLLLDLSERGQFKREKEQLEIQRNHQLKFYQLQLAGMQRQRELSHEYQNQIVCMQALYQNKEYEKLEEYFREITGRDMREGNKINTNHVIVNAVVNEKYREACGKGIIMVLKLGDLSELWLEDKDITLILSNLLNNAIEAATSSEQKVIKLKMTLEEGEFVLAVQNTYSGRIWESGGNLRTTKLEDREIHGYGVRNVKTVVEKYHGSCVIDHDEHEFWFSILIQQDL